MKESISPLIGDDSDDELIEKLTCYANDCYGKDMNIHHVHTHAYGDHIEVTFHMVFPKDITLQDAHDDATMLEHRIYNDLGIHATIHMEPEGEADDIE